VSARTLKKVRPDVLKKMENEGKMMSNESEEIKITLKLYRTYWNKYFGGCFTFLVANFIMILFSFCKISSDYVVG